MYCYLFGSYAKGKATEQSDVDLLISTKATGLRFYEIAERLRESLHKKVDLVESHGQKNDPNRTYMILTQIMVKADMSETYNLFDCLECWVTEDALPSGWEQKWLNVVLGKR